MDVRRPRSRRWRRPAAAAHWSRRRRILSCNRASRQDEWRQADTPNGELFTKTDSETHEVTIYHYDALGNLLSVDLPDGRLVEYVIDGQNRRIGKKIDGVLTKAWLYQNQLSPIAELDGSGNLTARYVYGSKPNTPDVVMKYSGGLVTTYRVITDHLGSPVMAVNVNNSSDVSFNAEYSAFGERTVSSGASSEGWLPFGFAGGLYDADTRLTRFGARDYDAQVGRWVSRDLILFDGGQTNLFVYVGNDPVNYVDLDGNNRAYAVGFGAWAGGEIGLAVGGGIGLAAGMMMGVAPALGTTPLLAAGLASAGAALGAIAGGALYDAIQAIGDLGSNLLQARKSDQEQIDWIVGKYGLSRKQRDRLHREISKKGMTLEEIEEIAEELASERRNSRKGDPCGKN